MISAVPPRRSRWRRFGGRLRELRRLPAKRAEKHEKSEYLPSGSGEEQENTLRRGPRQRREKARKGLGLR
jgi:hypothetical protein